MENKGGKNEVVSVTPEQAEQGNFGAVENFPPNIEMPPVDTESTPEQQNADPTPPNTPPEYPQQNVVKNTMPVVDRNAEQMPKQYLKIVEDATNELKARPHELQSKVIEFKKDYLRQAFGRELGEAA